MDILGTEQEILSLFHNMYPCYYKSNSRGHRYRHFYSIQNIVPVNNITESTEFILQRTGWISASGLSFARCWLRAEAVGMEESSPQKSSISTLVEDEPCETRKEISFWAGDFCFS